MFAHAKVMFEIYREGGYDRRYRAVYFTELDEHNKDEEIARATAGEHFYDGFIWEKHLLDAKRAVNRLLDRLNNGEPLPPDEVDRALKEFKA